MKVPTATVCLPQVTCSRMLWQAAMTRMIFPPSLFCCQLFSSINILGNWCDKVLQLQYALGNKLLSLVPTLAAKVFSLFQPSRTQLWKPELSVTPPALSCLSSSSRFTNPLELSFECILNVSHFQVLALRDLIPHLLSCSPNFHLDIIGANTGARMATLKPLLHLVLGMSLFSVSPRLKSKDACITWAPFHFAFFNFLSHTPL